MATSTLSEQRIAECLSILNSRQLGILARLYHMKQTLNSRDDRPTFLPGGDKSFDAAWKWLLKKFPSTDFKSGQSTSQPFTKMQKPMIVCLSPYYYNYVEALDIKDKFSDLLSRIAYCHIQFNITVNPDLTRLYLELLANHFAIMFLISSIADTKAILALFNFFYDQLHGKSEPDFPRMSQMFTEPRDSMLKSLHETVNPYCRTIAKALVSVDEFFIRRTLRAQNWNTGHFLDILHEPSKIADTVFGDKLSSELLSYDVLERWVVFGYLMIYPELKDEDAFNRIKVALKNSYVVVLFRDEVVNIHHLLQSFIDAPWTQKWGAKRTSEIKDAFTVACTQAPEVHASRRDYLRSALRQLNFVLADEPGLLGPKAFLVFWALSYATDEVHWFLRHSCNPPSKKPSAATAAATRGTANNDLKDPFLPELLFHIDELRRLVQRYAFVIQRFYIKFLAHADAIRINEHLGELQGKMPDEQFAILSDIGKVLSGLSREPSLLEIEAGKSQVPSFEPIRLDWYRLQVFFTCKTSTFDLASYTNFAEQMHSAVFHTRLVDLTEKLLNSVSDLSIFMFYSSTLTAYFEEALNMPTSLRFSIVFPAICGHSLQACHPMCPEERLSLSQMSFRLARQYCHSLAVRISQAVRVRVDEFGDLADQLAPSNAVQWLTDDRMRKKNKKKNKLPELDNNSEKQGRPQSVTGSRTFGFGTSGAAGDGLKGNRNANSPSLIPGSESMRRDRANQTRYDKALFNLCQLCQTVNHHAELLVAGEMLHPREILELELESTILSLLSMYPLPQSAGTDQSTERLLIKPTDLLRRVRALMNVLLDLENHVSINVIRIFSSVLTQQTQLRDGLKNQATMASHYCNWYRENLIKYAFADHFVYSPLLKSFVTMVPTEKALFRAEDYADLNELRALAQLIGPLGIRELIDQIIKQEVGERLEVLNNCVLVNRSKLETLRGCFDDPVKTRQLTACLQNTDQFLKALIDIGIVLAFKRLCEEAVNDNLQNHTPFLVDLVKYVQAHVNQSAAAAGQAGQPTGDVYAGLRRQMDAGRLASAVGLPDPTGLDPMLARLVGQRQAAARQAAQQAGVAGPSNADYDVACLTVVFAAAALPSLARQPRSLYHVALEANENNCHCLAYSVNAVMVALFSVLRPGDLEARSVEFLALASSNLLRLGLGATSSVVSSDVAGAGQAAAPSPGGPQLAPADMRDSVYILFDNLIRQSPCLSHTLQEACFPYSLIRTAYHNIADQSHRVGGVRPASGGQLVA